MIDALPNLKLIVTSGMRNAAIDVNAAAARGIPVCGTDSLGSPTSELTIGLILELARKIGIENARLKSGAKWQSTLGIDLYGKTLGIIGLGQARHAGRRSRQCVRHEGDRLEPEPHRGKGHGKRRDAR